MCRNVWNIWKLIAPHVQKVQRDLTTSVVILSSLSLTRMSWAMAGSKKMLIVCGCVEYEVQYMLKYGTVGSLIAWIGLSLVRLLIRLSMVYACNSCLVAWSLRAV